MPLQRTEATSRYLHDFGVLTQFPSMDKILLSAIIYRLFAVIDIILESTEREGAYQTVLHVLKTRTTSLNFLKMGVVFLLLIKTKNNIS